MPAHVFVSVHAVLTWSEHGMHTHTHIYAHSRPLRQNELQRRLGSDVCTVCVSLQET